jgi:glycerophosphoryl diester phosphodiesterase
MTAKKTRTATARARKTHPQRLLDRSAFLRPIAHRGLHRGGRGPVENTEPAFRAAMQHGYGIECDLQPASDGTPMVFHDDTLDRLVAASGRIAARTPESLARLRYRRQDTGILTFTGLLDLVAGQVPLLVEVKAERGQPPPAFLEAIADIAAAHRGPVALMSFNTDVVEKLRALAPKVPVGLVIGRHQVLKSWLARAGTAAEGTALSRLLDAAVERVSFFAMDVRLVKAAAAWREQGRHDLPLFSWTIRTARQRATAQRYADAPIFEGYEP